MTSGLRVFAQSAQAIDIDAYDAHASRFFATRLGFAEAPFEERVANKDECVARDASPAMAPADASPRITTLRVRFVIAPTDAPPGIRATSRRAREAIDLLDAERAEARTGPRGLGLLARRCETVWVVDREGPEDALALRLAAILASVLLGPIFDDDAQALFGVKTARERLETLDRRVRAGREGT